MRHLLFPLVLVISLAATATAAGESPAAREEIRFASGDFRLVGDLLTPATPAPHPVVVYVWGSGPTRREGHIERSRILRSFLDAGFAVFLYDKPGSGGSTGTLDRGRLFEQRAAILVDALAVLADHPAVRPDAIGLYGSSQAAYVMEVALERTRAPAFMVAWSCPMQDSLEQSAYLVRNHVLCAGGSVEEADRAHRAYLDRGRARRYADYEAAARILDAIPAIRDDLGWAGVWPEESWSPADPGSERFLDPSALLADIDMPVLALYAENDRQVDARQGAAAFEGLLTGAADGLTTVVTIAGADHNMILSPRGCMQDQRDRYAAVGGATLAPAFLETVGAWLARLRPWLVGADGS